MGKIKVLIVDDEKDLLDILKERLELEGYEVGLAQDGEEGLEKARMSKPDLMICDIMMPKKNGFDVLKEVRKDTALNTIFIMLTVVDDFDKIKKAYDDEADFYITKPVDLANLLKNIRILLNLSKVKKDQG